LTKSVLLLLDRFDLMREIFFEKAQSIEPISILLGDELGYEYLTPCGFVFTRFSAGTRRQGVIGVVGPCRLNYPVVIPAVRYIVTLEILLMRFPAIGKLVLRLISWIIF